MSDIEELKKLGGPILAKAKEEQNNKIDALIKLSVKSCELQETNIVLLSRLCDLKEQQQASDNAFRNSWAAAKIKDTWLGIGVLTIASVALYLDYFRGWPVFKWLKSLIG